jgi:hypothetical protein
LKLFPFKKSRRYFRGIRITFADWLIIIACLSASAVSAVTAPRLIATQADEVEIVNSTGVVGRYSLHEDQQIAVEGRLGKTWVVIKDGKVRITDSPCPHKICTCMGEVGVQGGFLACLPNQVVVKIVSRSKEEVDARTW